MKFCPKCGTKNEDGAIVCKTAGCEHRFEAAGNEADKPAATGGAGKGRRYCPKCGTANAAEAAKCVRCAAPFPAAKRPGPPPPKPSPSPHPDRHPWQHAIATVAGWSVPQKAAAALVACATLWGITALVGGGKPETAAQPGQTASVGSWGLHSPQAAPMGSAPREPRISSVPTEKGHKGKGPSQELTARAGAIMFNQISSARALSESEEAVLEQYWRESGYDENFIASMRYNNQQARIGDFMYAFDMAHYANMHRSHQADMAQLDAEAKLQADRDWLQDFHLASMDHQTVDQFRTSKSLGIITPLGFDSVGCIGKTLWGDLYRVNQNGDTWKLHDDGRWYPN